MLKPSLSVHSLKWLFKYMQFSFGDLFRSLEPDSNSIWDLIASLSLLQNHGQQIYI